MDDALEQHALAELVPGLLALCAEAGEAILKFYHAPEASQFQDKEDDTPLTQADLASDDILCAGLPGSLAGTPVLSEESHPSDPAQRLAWRRYWLVDPLDGTKEFLARTGEFTVNIALVEAHVPVLGVLYQPLARVAHVGIPGLWARAYHATGTGAWEARDLHTRPLAAGDTLTVLASRRHRGRKLQQCLQWLDEHWGPVTRADSGSALKFCQMADGEGDFYPRFSPCSEWDTAAGQALLEAAGGRLVDLSGAPLRYNTRESLLSPHFFALSDARHRLWRNLIASGVMRK